MLSEDHLATTSDPIQHHNLNHSAEEESKAVARQAEPPPPLVDSRLTTHSELLTSETDIFHVGLPSVFEDILEDILSGSDQPILSPSSTSTTKDHGDSETDTNHRPSDDSDSSVDVPRVRRRDSIMAQEQFSKTADKEFEQVAEEEEQTAVQRVLGTYELLENILVHMMTTNTRSHMAWRGEAMGTILLAQRVNRTFHHIVQRSSKLQEHLFFRYQSPNRAQNRKLAWNPLLTHQNGSTRDFVSWSMLETDGFIGLQLASGGDARLDVPTVYSGVCRRGALPSSQESWRRMLISKGTTLRSQLQVGIRAPEGHRWQCDDFVIGAKTTMGQLWNKIKAQRQWT
ncbi:hypothetical protein DOTSEDRAFT_29585 [Dothistroma septosporum NZE10]|uniref:Uncharacterized protein n=1 Tax=Dothistroma septosporum (strain NZE10 / CBS 128990) TaxID=675120 RepID=N1PBQ8_DOTSN|nr:hypothetical protein DOTSEDRAFT_29585 [Dothistroma septosporum NZE10]